MPHARRIVGLLAVTWLALFIAMGWHTASVEYARVVATSDLHDAVIRHDLKTIETLLKAGHLVDEINEERVFGIRWRSYPCSHEFGVTPLYVAAFKGDYEIVDYLLRQGANPNRNVFAPYTILGRAASMFGGSIDIHGTGSAPEVPDEYRLRVIASLLKAGTDPNVRRYEGGETPLEMCQRMCEPAAEHLLSGSPLPMILESAMP